jgi:polyisoprenoid-binding protein YceI
MRSLLGIFVLLFCLSAIAQTSILIDVSLSPAGSFQAVSSKVKGSIKVTDQAIHADKISVLIDSFKTGIDLRDEHFAKHLNAETHPRATLMELKGSNGKASAKLEVNGVNHPVSFNYVTKNNILSAKIKLKASDFKLKKAEYLGVGVEDDVLLSVELPLK